MANTRVLESTKGMVDTTRTRKPVFDDIIPSSAWTEDSDGHYLQVDFHDFKKLQVTIVINSDLIKVTGNREINDKKPINFEKTFKLAKNSDVENIIAKFDGDILYVTVPKLIVEEKGQGQENPIIRSLSKNKEIVATAVIAFSLGVLVFRKLKSNGN